MNNVTTDQLLSGQLKINNELKRQLNDMISINEKYRKALKEIIKASDHITDINAFIYTEEIALIAHKALEE